jgi:Fibronectin type III domain
MRARSRKTLATVLIAAVVLGSAMVADYSAQRATSTRTSGDAGLTTDTVTLLGIGQVQSSGTALTRTTSNAIPAYADIVLDVYCQCTTAPTSMGFGGDGAHTFTLEGGVTVSSPAMGLWYYEINNVSAVASGAATMFGNMSSGSVKWGWGGEYVSQAATLGVDAIGPGGSSASGSTNISDNVTTSQAGDAIIFSAFSEASTATFSATARCGQSTLTGQNVVSGAYTQQAFYRLVSTVGKVPSCVVQSIAGAWLGLSLAIKAAGTPAAPTGLTVGSVTTTTVPLSWTRAPGPILNSTVYQATYAAGSCGLFTRSYNAGAVTSYTVTGLTTGQAVCFKVATWNSTGQGALAATGLVVTAEVPAAPTGLSATPTLTTIAYTWSLPSGGGILNGTLYVQTGCTGTWAGHNVASTGTSFTATGLTPHSTYCARASEWNITGQSSPSSSVSASTNIVPAAPTGFAAAGESLKGIYYEWDASPGGGLVNGTFYSEPGCSGPWTGANLAATSTNYELAGLSAGELVCAYVTAWNATGQSPASSVSRAYAASLPLPPRSLNGTGSETGINLSWLDPAGGGILNLTVYIAPDCLEPFTGISTQGVVQSFAVGYLEPSTAVCVYVTAWNSSGQSGPSATITVSTTAAPPVNASSVPPGGVTEILDELLSVGALLVLLAIAAIVAVAYFAYRRLRRW